ncbi:MAG: META domain-containing protein [Bacteroidia bacterium]
MNKAFAPLLILIALSTSIACKSGKTTPFEPVEQESQLGVVSLPLIGTTWWLEELDGKRIPPGDKRPYLEIYEDSTFAAEDGCSRITGTVIITEGNRIAFKNLVSSMNACPGQTLEAAFRRALENCDNYSIQGSTLGIQKGKKAPLARFIAVQGKG